MAVPLEIQAVGITLTLIADFIGVSTESDLSLKGEEEMDMGWLRTLVMTR